MQVGVDSAYMIRTTKLSLKMIECPKAEWKRVLKHYDKGFLSSWTKSISYSKQNFMYENGFEET